MKRRSFALVAAAAIVFACWPATEVELDVSTDIPCSPSMTTAVFVEHSDNTEGSATSCKDGFVGTFVVSPAGARDSHADVVVAMHTGGKPPTDCLRLASNECVVARRSFSFSKHKSGYVSVRLFDACRGVLCDAGQTCDPTSRLCVDATTDPTSDPEPPTTPGPPDGSRSDAPLDPICAAGLTSDVVSDAQGIPIGMVAVGGTVFWTEAPATGLQLRGVSTTGKQHTFATGMPPPLHDALATDGKHVFFGSADTVVIQYDPATPAFETIPNTGAVESIATDPTGFFFATTDTRLFHWDVSGGAPQLLVGWQGADVVGTAAPANDTLYVYRKPAILLRYRLPYTGSPTTLSGLAAMSPAFAAHDAGVYYAFKTPTPPDLRFLESFDEKADASAEVARVGSIAAIAYDADWVYWLDQGDMNVAAGVYRAPRKIEPKAAPPGERLTTGTYDQVGGLALVGGCLYFGASTAGVPSIHVAPRRRGP